MGGVNDIKPMNEDKSNKKYNIIMVLIIYLSLSVIIIDLCIDIEALRVIMAIYTLIIAVVFIPMRCKRQWAYSSEVLTAIAFFTIPIYSFFSHEPEYQFFRHWALWSAIAISIVYTIVLVFLTEKNKSRIKREKAQYAITACTLCIAATLSIWGALEIMDVECDPWPRDTQAVAVYDKAYTFTLQKTGPTIYEFYVYADIEEYKRVLINVTYEQYKKLEMGNIINVEVGKGLFYQPYYYYELNPKIKKYKGKESVPDSEAEFDAFVKKERVL